MPSLLLLLLLVVVLVPPALDARSVPSSQSKSFWDQIKANNEQRKASRGGPDIGDPGSAGGGGGVGGFEPQPSSGHGSSSLSEILESRKARRSQECRPDFCYRAAQSGRPAAARICGTDGKTYESRCMLQFLRRCHGQKIRVRHLGACGAPISPPGAADSGDGQLHQANRRSCQQSRLAALSRSSRGEQVIYVPQCRRDGNFRRVQCNYQLKYCFCVRKRSGKPLPGTGVQLPNRPRCKRPGRGRRRQERRKDGSGKRGKAHRGKVKKGGGGGGGGGGRKNRCSSRQRAQFNRNILKQFEIEFNATVTSRGGGGGVFKPKREAGGGLPIRGVVEKTLQQPERRSAEWKFSELDANSDGQLSYRETKALRKVTRTNIKPKGCARRFFSTCDINSNKRLERAEWILCFGLENSATAEAAAAAAAAAEAAAESASAGRAALMPRLRSLDEALAGSEGPVGGVGGSGGKGSLMELVARSGPVARKRKRAKKARPFAHKSCPLAREEALEKNRQLAAMQRRPQPQLPGASFAGVSNGGRVFVPECSPDGKYAKRQCHADTADRLCFCMDPDSGQVLKSRAADSAVSAVVDCETAHLRARATVSAEFRGCSQPLLRQFAGQLTVIMVQETRDAWTPQDSHLSVEARSLRLRFQRADVNRNGKLDRKEQRWWRRDLKSRWKASGELRSTRKCAANFLRFCNANKDAVVTLQELQACLGLPAT